MRRLSVALFLGLVLIALTPPRADAGLTVFTSRLDWETAVGSWVTETFDALTPGFLSAGTHDVGLFDVETDYVGSVFDLGGGDNVLNLDSFTSNQNDPSLLFSGSITAFGADWYGTQTGALLTLSAGGETLKFSDYFTSPGSGFLGIVSTTAFDRLDFGTEGMHSFENEVFYLNNASLSSSPAIPEPGTFVILGLGLAVGALKRRRRA